MSGEISDKFQRLGFLAWLPYLRELVYCELKEPDSLRWWFGRNQIPARGE